VDLSTLAALQELRELYGPAIVATQTKLKDLGLETTSRLKTVTTIVEKLRREKTRLSEMQDIAGVRFVDDLDLVGQDQVVERIVGAFGRNSKVIDRRRLPSYGYRALHVIVDVDGYLVEIQLRTRFQDLWAQAMEKFADEVGREVRYGRVPTNHQKDYDSLQALSASIASIEETLVEFRALEPELSSLEQLLAHHGGLAGYEHRVRNLRKRFDDIVNRARLIVSDMFPSKDKS
jgi:ppGpp synthetase/RelA/SpoT-type nucleotidyltranferase